MQALYVPFQWVIDATQRQPQWWCRQAVVLMTVNGLLYVLLFSRAVNFSFYTTCFFIGHGIVRCVWFSATPARLATTGAMASRFLPILYVLAILTLLMTQRTSDLPLTLFLLAVCGFLSFAGCKPPAPPKRKHSLVTQPGGA